MRSRYPVSLNNMVILAFQSPQEPFSSGLLLSKAAPTLLVPAAPSAACLVSRVTLSAMRNVTAKLAQATLRVAPIGNKDSQTFHAGPQGPQGPGCHPPVASTTRRQDTSGPCSPWSPHGAVMCSHPDGHFHSALILGSLLDHQPGDALGSPWGPL